MLPPSKWGKYYWTCLHITALGYPEAPTLEDKANYTLFFETFGKGLPCTFCKNHYARHFQELPVELYLFGRPQLFDWTVRFHNIVNRELGKPLWTYDQAWDWYTKGLFDGVVVEKQKSCDYNKALLPLNIFLIILLIIVFSYKFFVGKV